MQTYLILSNIPIYIITCVLLDFARNCTWSCKLFDIEKHIMTREEKIDAVVTSIINVSILSVLTVIVHPTTLIYYDNTNVYMEGVKFVIMLLISDLMFYIVHRIMHVKKFYKVIHKKHHQHVYTNVWSSFYFSKSELMLNWIFVFVLPISMWNLHYLTLYLYIMFMTLSLVKSHSGINIMNIYTSGYHDTHHLKFNVNYGSQMALWDYIFKTNYTNDSK